MNVGKENKHALTVEVLFLMSYGAQHQLLNCICTKHNPHEMTLKQTMSNLNIPHKLKSQNTYSHAFTSRLQRKKYLNSSYFNLNLLAVSSHLVKCNTLITYQRSCVCILIFTCHNYLMQALKCPVMFFHSAMHVFMQVGNGSYHSQFYSIFSGVCYY